MKLSRRQFINASTIWSVLSAVPNVTSAAAAHDIPQAYSAIAHHYNIPVAILYAVALAESGYVFQNSVRPWPWTLNIEGKGIYYPSKDKALNALETIVNNEKSVDIGLMQINWHWHQLRLKNTSVALSPLFNLHIGALILSECYAQPRDWWEAVGRYHAPGTDPESKQRAEKYRNRVKGYWQAL